MYFSLNSGIHFSVTSDTNKQVMSKLLTSGVLFQELVVHVGLSVSLEMWRANIRFTMENFFHFLSKNWLIVIKLTMDVMGDYQKMLMKPLRIWEVLNLKKNTNMMGMMISAPLTDP